MVMKYLGTTRGIRLLVNATLVVVLITLGVGLQLRHEAASTRDRLDRLDKTLYARCSDRLDTDTASARKLRAEVRKDDELIALEPLAKRKKAYMDERAAFREELGTLHVNANRCDVYRPK